MKTKSYLLLFTAIAILSWMSCSKKENPPPSTAVYSVNGGTTSHHNGEVCMDCHKTGGTGKYVWVIAGSVYKPDLTTPALNGVIYFWTKPGGTGDLVATLQVDAKGNFFTTSSLIPATGAYPQIVGTSGSAKTMSTLAYTGNCHTCHGANESRIWVD